MGMGQQELRIRGKILSLIGVQLKGYSFAVHPTSFQPDGMVNKYCHIASGDPARVRSGGARWLYLLLRWRQRRVLFDARQLNRIVGLPACAEGWSALTSPSESSVVSHAIDRTRSTAFGLIEAPSEHSRYIDNFNVRHHLWLLFSTSIFVSHSFG